MQTEVTLIAGTAIDWPRFTTECNERVGRSPTRELDNVEIAVGSQATFVAALEEFIRPGANPVTALKEADKSLEVLTFAFLVSCDQATLMSVLKTTIGLVVLSAEPSKQRENFIISGSLRNWKSAMIEGMAQSSDYNLRAFFNEIWRVFEKLGFRDLFGKYRRADQRDKTFALIPPR